MSPPVIEKKKKYTYKDYLCTPDDERYELIEGELIMTPSPVPYHQKYNTRFGVKEYWIVDPIEKTVEIYTPENENLVLTKSLSNDDLLESFLFPGLKIKLAAVFAY